MYEFKQLWVVTTDCFINKPNVKTLQFLYLFYYPRFFKYIYRINY